MSSTIAYSILILGGISFFCAAMLFVASRFFAVVIDEREAKLRTILPGANCGACGFAGCGQYAKDLLRRGAAPSECTVIDEEKSFSITSLLGVENNFEGRRQAVLKCQGGNQIVSKRFEYQGIRSCRALSLFSGGDKTCPYGCLGYGDCASVCPFEAISTGEEGLVVIDRGKCTGCGKCIAECPKGLLSLIPRSAAVFVACRSRDRGKKVMSICKIGCIACKKCEKTCQEAAIAVENNLAVINFEKCNGCGLCGEACPTASIKRV
jgi:Na+-translocating ferredoxin:NAD+ oxidoreductase RNF subunit RnfB